MGNVVNYGATVRDGTGDKLHAAFAKIDAGARSFTIIDKDLTAPPVTPALGAAYIVGAAATGAWATHDGKIAVFGLASTWLFVPPAEGMTAYAQDENTEYRYNGSAWAEVTGGLQSLVIACSDETTALTAGNGKVTFRMPYAFTLTGVRASLSTAQTSGTIFTVDINESGTTVLSTKLTIDNTEKTSTTAATAAVISDTALADDAEIKVDIDQIGDGTAKGLKVYLIGTKA